MRLNVRKLKFFSIIISLLSLTLYTKAQSGGVTPTRSNNELQEGMNAKDAIFFSNAEMYVGENPTTEGEPTMFIQGTAKFSNAAQIDQQGVTALTGDFVSVKDLDLSAEHGNPVPLFYYDPDNTSLDYPNSLNGITGAIRFVGQWNKQVIKREKFAYGTANTTEVFASNKIADKSYILNFPRIEVQKESGLTPEGVRDMNLGITTPETWYYPEKMGFVSVATNVAIQTAQLDITNFNRFSIDGTSAAIDPNNEYQYDGSGSNVEQKDNASEHYKINYGYADIRNLKYDNSGQSEVNLKLYNFTEGQDNAQGDEAVLNTNTYRWGDDGTGKPWSATFLRGITSPFKKLRSDYMFYHVLTIPKDGSMLGGYEEEDGYTGRKIPVENPHTEIMPGKGYFYAMDASRHFFDEITGKWAIDSDGYKKRARGGYNFSRFINEYKHDWEPLLSGANKTGLNLYSATYAANDSEHQRFNDGDVEFELKNVIQNTGQWDAGDSPTNKTPKLFMLGNPYMTPISLTPILGEQNTDGSFYLPSGKDDPRNLFTPENNLGSSANASTPTLKVMHHYDQAQVEQAHGEGLAVIRSSYWVVNSAFVMYAKQGNVPVYAFTSKYDYADAYKPATEPTFANKYIEPMQMFLIQAPQGGKFVFNNKMKTYEGEPFTHSIEQSLYGQRINDLTPIAATKGTNTEEKIHEVLSDWFVVEAVADNEYLRADRTAVRFYDNATLGYDSDIDEAKTILGSSLTKTRSSIPDAEEVYDALLTPSNVVYTSTPQGQALLGNGIGYDTKEIPLHYISSVEKPENVTLTVYGLEGLDLSKVEGVWLIDKENDNYKQDLLADNRYTFQANPIENPLEAENRFILRFYEDGDDNNPDLTEKPITCYYSGSTLYVGGLNEGDLNSNLQIFDLQGRMMGNTVINNYPSMEYQKPLGQGTFIVRITGKRNYTTKFVNIRNY